MSNPPIELGFLLCLLGAMLAACAAPAPSPAAAVEPVASPPKAEPPAALDAGLASEASAPPVAATTPAPEREPEADAREKPSRPPIEILTAPDTAFLINYSISAPVEAARKACTEKSGADDDALAKCMAEAREAFKADVLRFKKDGSRWFCIIYKRNGSRLDEVYSSRVELTEDSPSSVKIKFTGGDKGARPVLKNKREAAVQVPNDYSLRLSDSELGRLIYEAKIGLIGS